VPELPEVETITRELCPRLVGRSITAVEVLWPNSIAVPDVPTFRREVIGLSISEVSRRGKYIIFSADSFRHLLVHLRMTGQLRLIPAPQDRHPHDRVCFSLDNGETLCFRDPRKLGRLWLVDDPQTVLGHLGPEPLNPALTPAEFAARLRQHRGQLKPLLLNQRFLAGLGNIYTDEALFLSGLHPCRRASTLSEAEATRLLAAIREVLREAISEGGTTFDGAYRRVDGESGQHQHRLQVYRRTGQPCPRCGTPIVRIVVGGRGTHFCPRCQPLGIAQQIPGEYEG